MKNKNDDDEYKEENSQHQHGNETVINKTEEEEASIKRLMSTNFKQNFIQYVINIVTYCGGEMIELERGKKQSHKILNKKHSMLLH